MLPRPPVTFLVEQGVSGRVGDEQPVIRVRVERPDDRYALVRVSGEIDIATAEDLADALARARTAPAVVVDLSEVRFCAAAGLHCLGHVVNTGPTQLVCRAPGPVSLILGLLGLDQRWPVHHDLADAIAHYTAT